MVDAACQCQVEKVLLIDAQRRLAVLLGAKPRCLASSVDFDSMVCLRLVEVVMKSCDFVNVGIGAFYQG